MAFDKTVLILPTGGSTSDAALSGAKPLFDLAVDEFAVKVCADAVRQTAGIDDELFEGGNKVRAGGAFKTVNPVMASGTIKEHQGAAQVVVGGWSTKAGDVDVCAFEAAK